MRWTQWRWRSGEGARGGTREAVPGVVRLGVVGSVIVVALGGAALSLRPGPLLRERKRNESSTFHRPNLLCIAKVSLLQRITTGLARDTAMLAAGQAAAEGHSSCLRY